MNNAFKKLKIKDIKKEVEGFKTFVFEEGHGIHYKAGQYLTFIHYLNGAETRRSYSITSAPVLNEPLSIGVKRIENGFFSRQLVDRAKIGDEIITTGAGGLFTLPEEINQYRQVFFFAAGSGITPVFSLIKEALNRYAFLDVVLIYSNASPEKIVFLKELQQLQNNYQERFHIEFLFSNAANLSRARLHRELLFSFIKQFAFTEKERILFYICGPESYMRFCTYTLQEMGYDKNNIKKENFVISPAIKKDAVPPDKHSHHAHITIGEEWYDVLVNYPDSILKAAKKQGVLLPYSCEAGRCGNCVAKCTSGKIWHSYNEVLTEKELNEGLILTCVGHPIEGDIDLYIA